ncbi:MAG TPA: hypothetical protein VFO16_08085 [Pseudonocardiaceae bacterium]|nr:hypothetical protein [Pseudonocardiaceae bacterium]
MPDIRFVCLSDVHFGAENSILSRLVKDDHIVDTTRASPVLDRLIAALATLIEANEDKTRKPTLILNGDILELALASDNVALAVFELFLDRIFPADGEPLFDDTILYQVGNHDHHLWETARELQYANVVREFPAGTLLPIPWHATKLYYREDTRPVHSELLERVARRRSHRRRINIRVSYPNMGIRSADGRTSIVFHHGHFVEPLYHLMTTLRDFIFPGRPLPTEVWDIEAENFAWIDFFWSTLGRSGEVGEYVGLIYNMLQSKEAIEKLAGNLAAGITNAWIKNGKLAPLRWPIRRILTRVAKTVASRIAARERTNPQAALSHDAENGLTAYLRGPLIKQLVTEARHHDRRLPDQLKLVFGHTHKPFIGTRVVPGLAKPVRVFNTGGWVVDSLDVEPMYGASVVLIDENLEVACVRLYNQAADAADYRVRLDNGLPAEQGPFYRRLSILIQADDEVWKSLSAAAAELVTERMKALARIIADTGRTRPSKPSTTPYAPMSIPRKPVKHRRGSDSGGSPGKRRSCQPKEVSRAT